MSEDVKASRRNTRFTALAIMAMIATCAFLIVRTSLFLVSEGYWHERLVAGALLFAETFFLVNCVGYLANVLRVLRGYDRGIKPPEELPELENYPSVAIIVSCYHEPLDVVEKNLICFRNLTYPNKHIYFLDDTRYELASDNLEEIQGYRIAIDDFCREIGINVFRRRWHGAKAGMINDFLEFIGGRPPEGCEFNQFQKTCRSSTEKYIALFDADMNPLPDFVEGLVQIMEQNEEIAFVQTPQYYSNFETNRVACAAGMQQAIFYEYICEGKSSQDAMFCCGTNVIFRRQALVAVGGFDEASVTEDFATSIKIHLSGWSSAYLNRICAFGMGPEDLGGYFKQQFRWALGTTGLFRPIFAQLIRHPGQLPMNKWCEYTLSSTYYFIGWAFFILLIGPVIYLFFNTPSFFAHPGIFFLFCAPYIALTITLFLNTMRSRSYRRRDIWQGLLLTSVAFPIYMKGSLLGLLGIRGRFGITPKSGSTSLPLLSLWPQIAAMTVALAAAVWGLNRLYYIREPALGLLVNIFWCLYNFGLLSTVFYFNNAERQKARTGSAS
jgi:cellulose synthase (UDP-forming)